MSNYSKDIILQGIARIIGGVLSFGAIIIFTYYFDESSIGKYNLTLTTINVIAAIFSMWLVQGILRYYSSSQKDFVFTAIIICSVLSLFIYIPISIVSDLYISINSILFLIIFIIYSVLDSVFRKIRNLISYLLLELCFSLGRLFPMIIIALAYKDIDIIFLSQNVLMSIFIIYLIMKKKINIKWDLNLDIIKKYLIFGLPLLGLAISNWFLTSSARYLIRYFDSDFSVGIYSQNYSLAYSICMMLSLIIINAMHPIIMKNWDEERNKGIETTNMTLNYYLLFMIPVAFWGCLNPEILLTVFKSIEYSQYSSIFSWTVISVFIYGIGLIQHKYYEVSLKTKYILYFNLLCAIINVVLNYIYIPIYGFSISAFIMFLSYVFYSALVFLHSHKAFSLSINKLAILKIVLIIIPFYIFNIFLKRIIVLNFMSYVIEGIVFCIYIIVAYQKFRIFNFYPFFKQYLKFL